MSSKKHEQDVKHIINRKLIFGPYLILALLRFNKLKIGHLVLFIDRIMIHHPRILRSKYVPESRSNFISRTRLALNSLQNENREYKNRNKC